jgi:type I restriction enzyme S subunit
VIGSRAFTDYILGIQTGTAVPHISGDQIKRYRFMLPPLSEQREIGEVLGTIDERISLNRRMNETLASMQCFLFKNWFVDFGPTNAKLNEETPYLEPGLWSLFPGALGHSNVPLGWSLQPLDEVADFLNGLALQKYPPEEEESLPVIKITELRQGISPKSDRASKHIPPPYVVNDGDILFSWSGSLTHVVWTGGPGALNQHLFKVTSEKYPKWFVYHWIGEHLPKFQSIAASKATTMGHIQRHHLREAVTVVPDVKVLSAVDKIIGPLFERHVANSIENRQLSEFREFLLPKLMSGEVRLNDSEKMLKDIL